MGDSYELAPHWIMRLLGFKSSCFSLAESGLQLETAAGDSFVIRAESLGHKDAVRRGLLFSSLVLMTSDGEKSFGGLQRSDAEAAHSWLRRIWYRQLAPEISETATKLRTMLASGYLRTSLWERVRDLAA